MTKEQAEPTLQEALTAFGGLLEAEWYNGDLDEKAYQRLNADLAAAPEPVARTHVLDEAGRCPDWYAGYQAAMRDEEKRAAAPEPVAASEGLDGVTCADGTQRMTACPVDGCPCGATTEAEHDTRDAE